MYCTVYQSVIVCIQTVYCMPSWICVGIVIHSGWSNSYIHELLIDIVNE